MSRPMKNLLPNLALWLFVAAPANAGLLDRILTKTDYPSRPAEGHIFSNLPKINYEKGVLAVSDYNYKKAENLFVEVIKFGPSNNPVYFSAKEWVTTKMWVHMAEHYPVIISGERSSAEILLDKAKNTKDDIKRREYLEQAKIYLDDIKKKESELEIALKRLERRN